MLKLLSTVVVLLAFVDTATGAVPPSDRKVELPLRLMDAKEILRAIHDQTDVRYAFASRSLVRQIDTTPFDGQATVGDLVTQLAGKVVWIDDVVLLESELSDDELRGLKRQLKSKDPDERRVAAYLLGNTRSTQAIAPLAKALGDKNESVRHHALRSLDRLERDLRPALGNDRPLPLTQANYQPAGRVSVFGLVKNLPTRRLETLLKSAPHASSNQWLWSASLLARCDGNAKLLQPGLEMGYKPGKRLTAWGIAQLQPSESAKKNPAPAKRDTSDPSTNRAEQLLALGEQGGPEAWGTLIEELANENMHIRRGAIRGLRRSPDPRAIAPLMHVLVAEKALQEDRELAAQSLGMIASKRVVEALDEYVPKTDQPISMVALALGWTLRPDAVPALATCLESEKAKLRYYAYTALWQIGTPEAMRTMLKTYNEYDNLARYQGHAAVRLAGHNQEVIDWLVNQVNTATDRIAVHGLEMSEDPRAVDALITTIPKSKDDRLQYAVQALGRIGDPKAVALLTSLMNHPAESIAYDAMRQLRWRWYFHRKDVRKALRRHPLFRAIVTPPPTLEKQPENTWVLRNWPVDLDDDRAINTSYEVGHAFDTKRNRVVKWGSHGKRCDCPQLGETWLFDMASNRWARSRAPVEPYGTCGTWGIIYDPANDAVVAAHSEGANHGWQWWRGLAMRQAYPWVYSPRRDRWTPMQIVIPGEGPGLRGYSPISYHPGQHKVLLWAGQMGHFEGNDRARMWTYDTHRNAWTHLPLPTSEFPPGRVHQAMCYMPNINRMMLVGGSWGGNPKNTWLYDLNINEWKNTHARGDIPDFQRPARFDPVTGRALHFGSNDYSGTHVWGFDPRKNEWAKVPRAKGLSPHHDEVDVVYDPQHNVFVMNGGHLGWKTDLLSVSEVWTYKHKHPSDRRSSDQQDALAKIEHDTPSVPEGVVVSVLPDRSVEIRWEPSKGVTGYSVESAPLEVGRLHPTEMWLSIGEFKKLTKKPLSAGEHRFLDKRPLRSARGTFNHYVRVYQVKAIGKGGESGPSAQVVTLTTSVPSVRAVEQPSGATKISWAPSPEQKLQGYRVYRMDSATLASPILLTPSPVLGTEYFDWPDTPRAERRRYYVVAVDALGQEGLPSTGAWAFGRP